MSALRSSVSVVLALWGWAASAASVHEQTLVAPFRSSVKGITIPNTHVVSREAGFVLRGMRPRDLKEAKQLRRYGVTDVLVFRDNPEGADVIGPELKLLKQAGFKSTNVTAIPFRWKNHENFEKPCRQTIEALRTLRAVGSTAKRGIFVHCTVGEDRTGFLAALYRVLYRGEDAQQMYAQEMCARGYADGDPKKPLHVVDNVHGAVTVLYRKMIYKVAKGSLKASNLDPEECTRDPAEAKDFASFTQFGRCEASPLYDPSVK